ncbi:MAG: adenylate/guanylate cyclase domain-containing protein, partial [Candidatus Promineifilaceae bacterium]|nr:adenylate/guanylate cyclase domain-containing protein [Candidatus Promineifilaceae bacterium]
MNCSACQTDNREIARFCRECGRFLASACPHCGAELPSASRYCDQCGQPLAVQAGEAGPPSAAFPPRASRPITSAPTQESGEAAGAATTLARFMPEALVDKLQTARSQGGMVGERRFVTMLFCDVSGSTAAASGMDPEEWAGVINGAFEHMIAPIYRYEGTVARLMGDGLLAFFGAPIAHEDDPVRAVRAGLDIVAHVADYNRQVQQQHGVELAVRVGINSGRVVVGAVGSDLRVEYSALGDAINIAARMEQAAAPNTVQIAAATHRLVAPLFEIEELGEIEVKGKAEPVPAYRVLGRRAEPGRLRGIAGLESPLVGRQAELDTLRQQLDDLTQGRGGIVFLLGQPGLGKSRLLREWRADWPESEGPRYWSISQEASYQAAEAYGLLRQLLRLVADVGSDDGQAEKSLRTRLEELVGHLPSAGQSDILVPLARLLDVQSSEEAAAPVQAETFRRQLFAATRAVLQQLTERQPTALILDDLHWADPASTDAISSIFQLVDAAPLLFVCVMRPEREAASWELYNAAKNDFPHRLTEIALSPLSDHESVRLLEGLLPGARWPRRLREQVLEKASGVPFFLEEVVRALLEDDVIQQADDGWKVKETGDDVRLPGSLQGLLTARLDRLEEESRRILQLASVIGQAFDYPLLAQLCGAANGSNGSPAGEAGTLDRRLTELQRADLIVETARIPQRRYLFRNTLIQETAYRTMLREQRRATHREVAEALTGRNGEELAALAHHFYQAGDPRAVAANRQAGDAAFDLHAGKEAATYYRRALELARRHQHDDVALLIYLYRRLGRSLELASQFSQALDLYADMKELGEELDDRQLALDAMLRQA